MAGILTALLSGALMSIQGVFNTEVTKQTSTWLAAGWVQISAFVVCLAAWCITGREPIGDLFRVKPFLLNNRLIKINNFRFFSQKTLQ